jgi:hypothetical protein
MAVPYTFGSATTSIPLSQLDSNFATAITLGNTAVQLGNTITNLTGITNLASATSLTIGTGGNTTAITISSGQVTGINATPQTWSGSNGALQVGTSFSVFSNSTSYSYLSSNVYFDTVFKYIGTGRATQYSSSDGNHVFSYAPSGTGGTAVSLTQSFIVANNGNSAFGASNPGGEKLRVEQPSSFYGNSYPMQVWGYASKQVINLQMDGSVNPIFNADPESYWAPPTIMTWQYRGGQKLAILNNGALYSSATVGAATIDTTGTTTAFANGATQTLLVCQESLWQPVLLLALHLFGFAEAVQLL